VDLGVNLSLFYSRIDEIKLKYDCNINELTEKIPNSTTVFDEVFDYLKEKNYLTNSLESKKESVEKMKANSLNVWNLIHFITDHIFHKIVIILYK
jgi:hypothetical protein